MKQPTGVTVMVEVFPVVSPEAEMVTLVPLTVKLGGLMTVRVMSVVADSEPEVPVTVMG